MNLRIRQLREEKGLTQSEVAEVLHCDQSLYSRYELGLRQLPLETAIQLSDYYQVSLDYLVCLTEDPGKYRP